MQALRIMVCVAAAAVGACASEPAVGVAYYLPPDQEDPCPPDGCGGNSPVIDGVYFWKLHAGGAASPEGVQLTGVKSQNGVPMRLELVEGDRLRGVDPMTGVLIAEHTALIGTRIGVSVKGAPYEILIEWVASSEQFWVGGQLPIEAYDLFYRPLGALRAGPLCSEVDGDPNRLHALVFGGDVYDPKTKAIEVGAVTAGWLNIACTGSAIYKMHKIGYTTAAQGRLGIVTTVEQRRAMLNAWTSNVCGTGEAFTHQGEPITLRESLGLLPAGSPYLLPTKSPESIWDEYHAVCLDTHRLDEEDPDIYTKLEAACGGVLPPSCADLLGDWTAHGHVLTGNP